MILFHNITNVPGHVSPRWPKAIALWVTALFFFLGSILCSRADQFDDLRLYWQNYLISNGGSPSSIANTANSYWSSMNTSPTRTYLWSDLPFGSVSANIVSTFQRLQVMALAWATPGSSLYGNASLASAVASGLDWMNANVYTTTATEYDNWFHWEDSGPMALDDTMVLLYPALTGTQITNYCNAIDHFGPVGYPTNAATFGWMTGANRSDKVLVMLLEGIVSKNSNDMGTAQINLSPVFLYVTAGDGFYTDGSFVFHSNGVNDGIAYNGHYGLVLLGDIPQIVDLLQGSTWQITDPNLANVYAWVTNSFEPFLYNGVMMDTVRGRIVSWSYETESGDGSSTLSAIGQIAQFAPPAIGVAFTNFINSPRLASGQFQFPSMDRAVALRNGFGFAISMSSSRIANYESINSGNLHGWHQGDGMTYLYIGNTENQFSSDFWPTVDPYHLPGTTAETNSLSNSYGEAKTTDQSWVGGAQVAGTYGVAGMSLHPYGTTLYGEKSWFMFDNEIVCLGAGITSSDTSEVQTTAENRRLGNPITESFTLNGSNITPTVGWSSNLPSATPSWCALSGTGGYYFPAGNSNLQATFTANSGSWSQINSGDDGTSHTDDYLKLWFNHGVQPVNASYSYVILPNMSATSVSNYALAPDIIIVTNTSSIQAVKKPALGVEAANFWTSGNNSEGLITANDKASVIVWGQTNLVVGVSDPTQTNNNSITITLNESASGLLSADPGITVLQLSPNIIFKVNVSGSLGKTYQASFSYTGPGIPIISSVYPNGANLFQSTNTLSFNIVSGYGISTNNVVVTLNGVAVGNLVFSGSTNNWNVSYPFLQPNQIYTAVITATDGQGNTVSETNSFDTFSAANYTWEAEDFDYNGGSFIDNPQTNAYAGLAAVTNVDSHQVNFAGTFLYRPNGMDTEINGDVLRPQYTGTSFSDYSIGYFSPGAWANYTRHYPAGSYHVYARLASGSGATTCTLYQVTGGLDTTAQTTNLLGTFSVPLTAWESYNYIPLLDNSSNFVTVTFNGFTNTLRLARPSSAMSDCNANFLMLIPTVFTLNAVQNNNNIVISFPTQSGFNYQVQYKNSLTDAQWKPLATVAGNNTIEFVQDTNTVPTRFYRVHIQ
jgi:hyaluronate lyase